MNATVTSIAAPVGWYLHDGGVFRVVEHSSGQGRYAEGLIVYGSGFRTARWVMVAGLVTRMSGAAPLTVALAAEMGRQLRVCVVCGHRLGGPGKVARGIHEGCDVRLERA